MDRRTFVALVGGGILASPLAGETQQSAKVPQIGVLGNMLPAASAEWGACRQGLRELGWIEGQNVAIAYRGAEGNPDRFPALAVELVQLKVDVIVVTGPPAIHAVRNATSTIPIVFVALADPVASGYVTSLARPGGNLTGLASQYEELITKQLQLLKEAVPTISRIALLHHRESWPAILNAVKSGGKAGQVKIVCFDEEAETLLGVADGIIHGTVVQQPFEFGKQAITRMAKYLSGEKSALAGDKQIIPTLSIKKENVAEFQTRLKQLLGK